MDYKKVRREAIAESSSIAYSYKSVCFFYRRLDNELITRVKCTIRQRLSARHIPQIILETKEIPYTASGKKVEVAVKRILSGEPVTSRGALANPNSLDFYYNIQELKL